MKKPLFPAFAAIGASLPRGGLAPFKRGFWRDERVLRVAAQAAAGAAFLLLGWWMFANLLEVSERRGLTYSMTFLKEAAGFAISDPAIPFTPANTFAYALFVGVLNTFRAAIISIFLATVLGVLIGVARLSSNWLVSQLAHWYVELHRNVPHLVLLYAWYAGVFLNLPRVKESVMLPGPAYLNQRGLYVPRPMLVDGWPLFAAGLAIGLTLAAGIWLWLRRRQLETGRSTYYPWFALLALVAFGAAGWFAGGRPLAFDVPVLDGFNFTGGARFSTELTCLVVVLFTYTAAFIGEVVRAGIQAVPRGQVEAARALGLHQGQVLRLVVFPQALRVIIPPLISQYLNLTKNTSLAVFIAFPDLFYVGTVTMNQSGRAVQVFAIIVVIYLAISLLTSLVLNLYNRRFMFAER